MPLIRYIIISIPPEPLASEILGFQRSLSELSGASEALRYPPHLTLRTGLVCPDEASADVVHAFLEHARGFEAADIACSDLVASSYLDAAGVERGFLGYHVELSGSLLGLHRGLLEFQPWKKGPQATYSPHVSLCYHDVSPAGAAALLEEEGPALRRLLPAWRADRVELWAQSGDRWMYYAGAAFR